MTVTVGAWYGGDFGTNAVDALWVQGLAGLGTSLAGLHRYGDSNSYNVNLYWIAIGF